MHIDAQICIMTSQVGSYWPIHIAYIIIGGWSILQNHWLLNLLSKDHVFLMLYKKKLNKEFGV